MIKIEKTKLAWKLTLPFEHHDERGSIYQVQNEADWQQAMFKNTLLVEKQHDKNLEIPGFMWMQENIIVEKYRALRGLHSHSSAWLLMTCLSGHVVVGLLNPITKETERFDFDCYTDSHERYQLLVPPGIANGHCSLWQDSVFHYLWSADYRDEKQETYAWNAYGIDWGVKEPILSERDNI